MGETVNNNIHSILEVTFLILNKSIISKTLILIKKKLINKSIWGKDINPFKIPITYNPNLPNEISQE